MTNNRVDLNGCNSLALTSESLGNFVPCVRHTYICNNACLLTGCSYPENDLCSGGIYIRVSFIIFLIQSLSLERIRPSFPCHRRRMPLHSLPVSLTDWLTEWMTYWGHTVRHHANGELHVAEARVCCQDVPCGLEMDIMAVSYFSEYIPFFS